jgi:hypothetical protein
MDITSKSEEHFGADSFEVGHALTSSTYCPTEPLTSTIELAMRAYGIYSCMKQEQSRLFDYYRAFSNTANAIVEYYVDTITFDKLITLYEEMDLLQAADFLLEKARQNQQNASVFLRSFGGLDVVLDTVTDRLNQLICA